DWDLQAAMAAVPNPVKLLTSVEQIIEEARAWSRPGDYILIMSNGGFGDIHQKLLEVLAQ
ncbi:MAG TPA: UDP-N-acetylmuramate:L-alanyl-gamma-D-glutamyl-meso-diaminopimelate ligase, partial [Gammaproteobacteria bacterium]|nr:UDP-N-acetylmuramate:L-alanyl-gamma-D-glutamyl-meso-diaminopimelate ligase [Gammaproteobacteria bacterium]